MGDITAQRQWQNAIHLHRAGRLGEAEAAYRELFHADPQNAACLANLGMLLATQGRLDDALQCLTTALQSGPRPELYNAIGNVLRDKGEPSGAVHAYRTAIGLRPDYADA